MSTPVGSSELGSSRRSPAYQLQRGRIWRVKEYPRWPKPSEPPGCRSSDRARSASRSDPRDHNVALSSEADDHFSSSAPPWMGSTVGRRVYRDEPAYYWRLAFCLDDAQATPRAKANRATAPAEAKTPFIAARYVIPVKTPTPRIETSSALIAHLADTRIRLAPRRGWRQRIPSPLGRQAARRPTGARIDREGSAGPGQAADQGVNGRDTEAQGSTSAVTVRVSYERRSL